MYTNEGILFESLSMFLSLVAVILSVSYLTFRWLGGKESKIKTFEYHIFTLEMNIQEYSNKDMLKVEVLDSLNKNGKSGFELTCIVERKEGFGNIAVYFIDMYFKREIL